MGCGNRKLVVRQVVVEVDGKFGLEPNPRPYSEASTATLMWKEGWQLQPKAIGVSSQEMLRVWQCSCCTILACANNVVYANSNLQVGTSLWSAKGSTFEVATASLGDPKTQTHYFNSPDMSIRKRLSSASGEKSNSLTLKSVFYPHSCLFHTCPQTLWPHNTCLIPAIHWHTEPPRSLKIFERTWIQRLPLNKPSLPCMEAIFLRKPVSNIT